MVIGQAFGLGCDGLQLLAACCTRQVGAEPQKTLFDFQFFEQVLHPQNAGMTERKAKAFVGFTGQAEILSEAIKGVVHSRFSWPAKRRIGLRAKRGCAVVVRASVGLAALG